MYICLLGKRKQDIFNKTWNYTLSHLENDRDVSAYSGGRPLSSRARNLCVFSRVQRRTPVLTHRGCDLQRVSLGVLSDVTVVRGMRQSVDILLY